MGYLKEKYTREYLLKEDEQGNPAQAGMIGVEDFKKGSIRKHLREILERVDFREKNILELGFGRGEAVKFALEHGAKKVVGVDFAKYSKKIAARMLRNYGPRADLYCEDALLFLKNWQKEKLGTKFDIVIMFDFIEHVPKCELKEILQLLHNLLSSKPILVINTPIYKVDNDVIIEGLKDGAKDDSDEFDSTRGMHCNRFTIKSLLEFMRDCDYRSLTSRFFADNFTIKETRVNSKFAWNKAVEENYPLLGEWKEEVLEYALTTERKKLIKKWQSELPMSAQHPDYNLGDLFWANLEGFTMLMTKRFRKFYALGRFENFTFDLLMNFIKEGQTFIDVGAHYGYYSLAVSKKIGEGKIYAFEPVKENFILLNKNVELNEFNNISVYDYAVSDKTEKRKFNITEASDSSGFYSHPLTRTIEERVINVISLDDFLGDNNVDIVKIDTEGHEMFVLDGMKKIIKNNDDIKLIIEFNPRCLNNAGVKPEYLLEKINDLGFDIYFIDDQERKIFRWSKSSDMWESLMKELEYANLLCIKKENSLMVSFFVNSLEKGGASRLLLDIIDSIIEKGSLVHLISPKEGPMEKDLLKRPIFYEIISYPLWINTAEENLKKINDEIIESTKEIANRLFIINPHIVYTNTSVLNIGALVAKIINKPHVWHIHEFGVKEHGINFILEKDEVIKFINENSNKIIFASKSLQREYERLINNDKSEVIYNFIKFNDNSLIERKKRYSSNKNAIKLLILGSIQPGKGQKDAILAVNEIVKENKNLELLIAGMAMKSYYNELIKIIEQNNLERYIKFVGYIDDPFALIEQVDIVLNCSILEGFGRTSLEAMLLKKPVIGANSGATTELISDNYNGLLYTPGNYKELSEKIRYLLSNPNKIKEFGENGYNFAVENFNYNKLSEKIYKMLIELKNKSRSQEKISDVEETVAKMMHNGFRRMEKNKIAIYTAIFGFKDGVIEPVEKCDGVDYICFTDNSKLKSKIFDVRVVPAIHKDPTRNARMIKILSHRFIPEYDYVIWIDGNIRINADRKYINYLLENCLREDGIALYRHPDRACIYKEAEACIELNKDNPSLIKMQMDEYRNRDYPENNGLIMSSVVVKKNKDFKIIKLCEDWWRELRKFSRRDQLAFNYVAWKNRIKYGIIPGNAYDNEYFKRVGHEIKKSISGIEELIEYKNGEIMELRRELSAIKQSYFWKIYGRVASLKRMALSFFKDPFLIFKKSYKVIKRDGLKMFFVYLFRKIRRFFSQKNYEV